MLPRWPCPDITVKHRTIITPPAAAADADGGSTADGSRGGAAGVNGALSAAVVEGEDSPLSSHYTRTDANGAVNTLLVDYDDDGGSDDDEDDNDKDDDCADCGGSSDNKAVAKFGLPLTIKSTGAGVCP